MKTIIARIIQTILIVILVLVAIVTFSTKIPFLSQIGLNFFYVISGSMEPTIKTGSLIYIGKYKVAELKKNDIITFYSREPKSGAVNVVTHRIIDVIKDEKKEIVKENDKNIEKMIVKYEFSTKGDANNTVDQRLTPSGNIIGLYKWSIPKLGYVTHFAQTPKGFVLMIIIPSLILVIWEIIDVIMHFKKKYEDKTKEEIEKLKKELIKSKKKHD